MTEFTHRTVLLAEAVELLKPEAGKVIVDGTLGGGGHTEALLKAGATVIGIDRDPMALAAAKARLVGFGERFTALQGEFGDVGSLISTPVDGFLLDLGVSSPQIDTPERGFSFQNDGPLDMRMSQSGPTAAELIETTEEGELADLIYKFGDERFSRQIARQLKRVLPKTTFAAVDCVKAGVPRAAWPKEINVATRTFQALRIAVNRELEQVDAAVAAVPSILKKGGRAAFITFHSLEDRIVKRAFRALCDTTDETPRGFPVQKMKVAHFADLTRKPISASDQEVSENPRARSALLRAVEKVS